MGLPGDCTSYVLQVEIFDYIDHGYNSDYCIKRAINYCFKAHNGYQKDSVILTVCIVTFLDNVYKQTVQISSIVAPAYLWIHL
ncbi:unnamed protein product [Rhizopus stolonifer]